MSIERGKIMFITKKKLAEIVGTEVRKALEPIHVTLEDIQGKQITMDEATLGLYEGLVGSLDTITARLDELKPKITSTETMVADILQDLPEDRVANEELIKAIVS